MKLSRMFMPSRMLALVSMFALVFTLLVPTFSNNKTSAAEKSPPVMEVIADATSTAPTDSINGVIDYARAEAYTQMAYIAPRQGKDGGRDYMHIEYLNDLRKIEGRPPERVYIEETRLVLELLYEEPGATRARLKPGDVGTQSGYRQTAYARIV